MRGRFVGGIGFFNKYFWLLMAGDRQTRLLKKRDLNIKGNGQIVCNRMPAASCQQPVARRADVFKKRKKQSAQSENV